MKCDYSLLRPLMRVDCYGTGPAAVAIRVKSAGWKHAFNRKIASHTGILFRMRNELLIAEMAKWEPFSKARLRLTAIEDYLKAKDRGILGFAYHPALDVPAVRDKVLDQIANDYRHGLEYDYKGILAQVTDKVKQDPKRYYCNEYHYAVTAPHCGYPERFKKPHTPYDHQSRAPGWYPVVGALMVK